LCSAKKTTFTTCRLKINLFTPVRQLAESKLILAAPSSPAKLDPVLRSPPAGGAGVNEEPKRSGARRSQNQFLLIICKNNKY